MEIKKKILANFFSEIKQFDIFSQFSVLHGFSPPNSFGRDIDILIRKENVNTFIKYTYKILKPYGLKNIYISEYFWGKCLFCIIETSDKKLFVIEFDLIQYYIWSFIRIIDSRRPIQTSVINNIPCAKWEGFCKRVLLQILAKNFSRFSSNKNIDFQIFRHEESEVISNMNRIFGESFSKKILNALKQQDLDFFKSNISKIRLKFIFVNIVYHPISLFYGMLTRFKMFLWKKKAPFIMPVVIFKNVKNKEKFMNEISYMFSNDTHIKINWVECIERKHLNDYNRKILKCYASFKYNTKESLGNFITINAKEVDTTDIMKTIIYSHLSKLRKYIYE